VEILDNILAQIQRTLEDGMSPVAKNFLQFQGKEGSKEVIVSL
jgi:hypothetical protein